MAASRPAPADLPGAAMGEDREREFVLLAHLVRPQGRHGETIADILTDFPERFAERRQVWLLPPTPDAAPRAATIESHWLHKGRPQSPPRGRIVLKFAGVDSIDAATAIAGWDVAVPRQARTAPTDDSVYIADLIGCHAIDEAPAAGPVDLGPIMDVIRGKDGAADMLVVGGDAGELLVPFAKAYIVSLDLEQRRLHMRLPEGLTAIDAPPTEEESARQRKSRDDDAL